MKWSIPVLASTLLAAGFAQGSLTQLDEQKLHDRMFQTALRGSRLREISRTPNQALLTPLPSSDNSRKRSTKLNA
jgi:hypothetical protein